MLTISSGHSAKYLTDAVSIGRENYYTGAVTEGEPPGRWYGTGAAKLGLVGLVDHQDMTALYEHYVDPRDPAFKDPEQWASASTLGHTGRRYATETELYEQALNAEPNASAERRAELWTAAGKKARSNVAFLDATFSVQKSVTVLHTAFEARETAARTAGDETAAEGWAAHRRAVETAIWSGNRAALDYLAQHAGYSRVGHHGGAAGRYTDAHDWTIASFFQHDNRNHDPQLHVHNAILNRVEGADGQWRTLDGRSIYVHRGAAAAVGERVMEEHLTRALGVTFATRPDGKAREVVGIEQVTMDLFSGRRRAITQHTAALVAAFETQFGREPNALELDRLSRQATFATRKAKSHDGETREQMLARWDSQLRAEVAGGLATVAHDVLRLAQDGPEAAEWSPAAALETALADVQAKKAAWTAPDLTRAISDALPDHLGTRTAAELATLLDTLTVKGLELAVPLDADRPGDAELPAALRTVNGRSAYDAPGRRLFASPEHVHTERVLAAATAEGGSAALSAEAVARFVGGLGEYGVTLGEDQAAAVRGVLASGARVESLVGPAGTGKSFVVGTLAKAWADPELWGGNKRRVFGLASSQIATEVLAGEGVQARNVTSWLGAQRRLAEHPDSPHEADWRLRGGDLVVVDESAMTNTADLAAIHHHVSKAGAKLLLVGDHRQLAAVGAGGGMEMLATAGAAYELCDARRFTGEWERAASLRLRAGDASVLQDYHRHGRLIDGGAVEEAERSAARAWLGDTLAGRESLLVVDTNEQAARLSANIRAELVRLGKVAEAGVPLGLQGTFAGVGDLVQGRKLAWNLAGYAGNQRAPRNRENYRVLETHEDGHLVVAPITGRVDGAEQYGPRMTLPPEYVAEHLALGYASTVHAAQGCTVDTTHSVITQATGSQSLYVGMSRGRLGNTAHVTTRAVPADAEPGTVNQAVHRNTTAVLAGTLEAADPIKSALATATESTVEAESVRTPAELFADAVELATAGRTATYLDDLVESGTLTIAQRQRIAAEDGGTTLTRVLRRAELAGHDPREVLADAVTSRRLDGSRQVTNVIYHRIVTGNDLDPTGDAYTDRLPTIDDPEWSTYLHTLATTADQRAADLGALTADDAPQWAVEAFGPVPEEPSEREEWAHAAGKVAAHRELVAVEDDADPVGAAPKAGQVEAYASYRSAWRALGRPEADRDELELSDGQLRVRVRAAEREAAWAPRFVGNELAGTIQAAEHQHTTARLREAEAETAPDPVERDRLRQQAAEAAELAAVLEQRTGELRDIEQARGHWLAHTAGTRAAAERATSELTARHAGDNPGVDDTVTAEEWLAAHRDDQAAEDPHRQVTDTDLVEHERADTELEAAPVESAVPDRTEPTTGAEAELVREAQPELEPVAETGTEDVRDTAAAEPEEPGEDDVRVPSQEDTAAAVERAQRALVEITARTRDEQAREDAERAQRAAQWHAADQQAQQVAEHESAGREYETEPELA